MKNSHSSLDVGLRGTRINNLELPPELEPLRYSVIYATDKLDLKRLIAPKCTYTVHETALGRFILFILPGISASPALITTMELLSIVVDAVNESTVDSFREDRM